MKKNLLYIILFFSSPACFAQAYIPMPSDSAIWRYRIYDIDYLTQVLDNILFLNGEDTIANGYTYHKIISRTCRQAGGPGFDPPVVTTEATASDIYYGAMREAGKKVYSLTISGEDLIYDFNAAVGDSIPAYIGKDRVTAIDSIAIGGVFHKRCLTADSTYFVIEGVGSNRGLIPALNDGTGTVVFYCFTDTPATWSPDTTLPCTYIYPVGYVSAISNINEPALDVTIYPVPASDVLHIKVTGSASVYIDILNCIGRVMLSGVVNDGSAIPVFLWPKGIYYFRPNNIGSALMTRKIVIE